MFQRIDTSEREISDAEVSLLSPNNEDKEYTKQTFLLRQKKMDQKQ